MRCDYFESRLHRLKDALKALNTVVEFRNGLVDHRRCAMELVQLVRDRSSDVEQANHAGRDTEWIWHRRASSKRERASVLGSEQGTKPKALRENYCALHGFQYASMYVSNLVFMSSSMKTEEARWITC